MNNLRYLSYITKTCILSALLFAVSSTHAMDQPYDINRDLFERIEKLSLEEVKRCLTGGANVNNRREFDGLYMYPIHTATLLGQTAIARELLDRGARINQAMDRVPHRIELASASGKTPLHLAVTSCRELVTILLARQASVNARDELQRTPLHLACHVSADVVEELLEKQADINARDLEQKTPLHYVAQADRYSSNQDIAKLLIERGADINARDLVKKWTPLQYAEDAGNREVAKLLIAAAKNSAAAKPSAAQPQVVGLTADVILRRQASEALHDAATQGDLPRLKDALSHGADINSRAGKNQRTPLLNAINARHHAIVSELLSREINVNSGDRHQYTALHLAASQGNSELAQRLIDKGALVNAPLLNGGTPLHNAAIHGDCATIKILLDKHASLNPITTNDKATPLGYAVDAGKVDAVRLLLERGADINLKYNGQDLRIVALQKKHAQIVTLLDKAAAEKAAKARNQIGKAEVEPAAVAKGTLAISEDELQNLLYDAVVAGQTDVVTFCLAQNADVNPRLPAKFTFLEAACMHGHRAIVKLLLGKNVQVNAQSWSYITALHWAAQKGHLNIVKDLLLAGADTELRDDQTLRPLDYAYRANQISAVRELLLYGSLLSNENAMKTVCTMRTPADSFSPLEQALIAGKLDEVRTLIPSQTSAKVNEALLFAAAQNHAALVEYLLQQGAQPAEALERLTIIMKRPLSDQLRQDYELIRVLLASSAQQTSNTRSQQPRPGGAPGCTYFEPL
jgi:ankyrin